MCEAQAAPQAQAQARRRHEQARGARGCRHWVGLAIVAIQMAVWCLVGALLMQRGISNLQRRDAPPATPLTDDPSTATSTTATSSPYETVVGVPSSESPGATNDSSEEEAAGGERRQSEEATYPEATVSPKQRQWSFFPRNSPVRPFASRNSLDEFRVKERADDSTPMDPLTPLKGVTTGAATAVVMVTVGGVMLVVGPAFLLVKVIDVYQRQSRANKISRQEDPPPSYDEVTEKAPRYSALFQVLDSGELMPLAGPGAVAGAATGAATGTATGTESADETGVEAGPDEADTDVDPTPLTANP